MERCASAAQRVDALCSAYHIVSIASASHRSAAQRSAGGNRPLDLVALTKTHRKADDVYDDTSYRRIGNFLQCTVVLLKTEHSTSAGNVTANVTVIQQIHRELCRKRRPTVK